ncbi:Carboxylic ester hydrolase [Mycena sanguinolenta]|uniref:Carboxylic ester hydrolase n=1 Tax=Mycena sanguinolenta TaxID=230812 RepID=A0A8H6X4V3_9AGAR|nr:Carboxylic ester hydrolase [Mycena sanguinolenta]
MPVPCDTQPVLHHSGLKTTLCGVHHQASSPELPIHQYRGIKYASIPARFRQSVLLTALPPKTDATRYGPICPQLHKKCFEEDLFGLGHAPQQILEQNEFECLNLNITCPAGLTPQSRLPVMLWIHGGGDRGYGSSWVYDGGSIVRKGMQMHKPVMVITFNFRIGLFGFAASPLIQEDNNAANDPGVGNYGLRDQRTAMQWVHQFIQEFGGDPDNVTVFGENTGASDILCHLQSVANERRPLFHRAIIQSAVIDHNIPNVGSAGWHISRVMAGLDATTVEELRAVSAEKLVKNSCGSTLRAVDDGYFFLPDWRSHFLPEDVSPSSRHHHSVLKPHDRASSRSRSRTRPHASKMHVHQPLIIGDTNSASMAWSLPASLWTSQAVVRRLNAICQSISNASLLLSSYDICSSTPDDEIVDRVLELIGDTRVSWPTECVASQALRRRAGRRRLAVARPRSTFATRSTWTTTREEHDLKFDSDGEDEWMEPPVTEWAYKRIRDTMQERWILFANGQEPWHADKVFVFGPEGEIGERSRVIFENRRRRAVWTDALEPLGMQLAQKVGMELSRGPPMKSGPMKF